MRTNDDNAGNKTNANLVVGCAFKPFKLQSNFSGFGSTDNRQPTTFGNNNSWCHKPRSTTATIIYCNLKAKNAYSDLSFQSG